MLMAACPSPAATGDQALLLEVEINGYSKHLICAFVERDGVLLAQRSELQELGLRVAELTAAGPDDLLRVFDLPGLTGRIDRATQILVLTTSSDILLPTRLQLPGQPEYGDTVDNGFGGTFKYDVSETVTGGRQAFGGLFDMRVFSPEGVASSGLLVRAANGAADDPAIRLELDIRVFRPGNAAPLSLRRRDCRKPWMDPPDPPWWRPDHLGL